MGKQDIDQINAIVAEAVAAAMERVKEEESNLRTRVKEERKERKDRHREERRQAGERPPSKISATPKTQQAESKVVSMTVTPPPSKLGAVPVDASPAEAGDASLPSPPSTGTVVWGAVDGVQQWIETASCD